MISVVIFVFAVDALFACLFEVTDFSDIFQGKYSLQVLLAVIFFIAQQVSDWTWKVTMTGYQLVSSSWGVEGSWSCWDPQVHCLESDCSQKIDWWNHCMQ